MRAGYRNVQRSQDLGTRQPVVQDRGCAVFEDSLSGRVTQHALCESPS